MVKLHIDGVDQTTDVLKKTKATGDWFVKPLHTAMAMLHNTLANVPKKEKGAFTKYASKKQKRAYWARVGSGEITHLDSIGYRRSGQLARDWSTVVRKTSRYNAKGILTNGRHYAPYVQGYGTQQMFHYKSGWVTDRKAIIENEKKIIRLFDKEAKKVMA